MNEPTKVNRTTGAGWVTPASALLKPNRVARDADQLLAGEVSNPTRYRTATIELQTSLRISGAQDFTNTEREVSIDQVSGSLIFGNQGGLKCKGVLVSAGTLQAYVGATGISKEAGFNGTLLYLDGGTLTISADDPSQFARFNVSGNMVWNGGVFECYVKGNDANERTFLYVDGNLTLAADAHLHINAVGNLTGGLTWRPIEVNSNTSAITGSLTFDNDNWAIAYITEDNVRFKINVISPN